ncbi:MAG: TonB-dependent siderophore receptor [Sphingopyxis sp.]|nr:TonB-dependent siderophore receptor [Sphingopyxis sp.]
MSKQLLVRLLLATAIGAIPASGFAQTPANAEEGSDEIIVTARAAQLYRVEETSSGKLPTNPLESSQSITVITKELIQDQGARDAQDLYRNISGVSLFSYAGVTARGFRQEEIFYDGLRGNPFSAFAVPQLFTVERLEFLKGPAGMLYGPGAPGGIFNYITKKPSQQNGGRVGLIGGTADRYGAFGEVNGALSPAISARAGLFYEDRSTQRFNAENEVFIMDGGVSADLGIGKLTVQGTRFEQNLPGNRLRGVPVDNDGNFLGSRRFNHNEPSDFLDTKASVGQVTFESDFSANFAVTGGLRYSKSLETQNYHEPRALFDSNADGQIDSLTRQFRDQRRESEAVSTAINAIWSNDFGGVKTRLLFGYDYFTNDDVFDGRTLNGGTTATAGRPGPLSFVSPVYGLSDSSTYALPAFDRFLTTTTRQGAYVLGEATIGPVILTLGGRKDRFNDREEEAGGVTLFKDSKFTWRAGAVYKIREDISLFGQYATTFEPQSVFDQDTRAGGPFAPTAGDIFEGGLKTALLDGRVQSSIAIYRIKRSNVLQSDPRGDVAGDGIDDLISFGEVTSKGIEFDIATDITPDWVLTASYAYNDTKITADNAGGGITNSVGNRFANAPKHQLGFWTRYQIRPLGLAVALGGDYVSERVSFDSQRVKPYMIFDSTISYQTGPYLLQLRVQNLFDKTYAASGFGRSTGHFPGAPRSAFLEASLKF